MRAVVIHSPGDLRVEEREAALPPGPDEVRLRTAVGGICGSDLHYYSHGGFGTVRIRQPMILGHEVAGVVTDVGKGVLAVRPGDKVAMNPSMPCGHCRYCRQGLRNHCEDMRFFGSAMRFPHMQGMFRDEITLPGEQVFLVGPQTDLRLAACSEPLAVCLHAVQSAGALLGRRVLVSGCGPIGCLTLVAALHAGAQEVVCTDVADAPLAIAARLGAKKTVNVANEPEGLTPYAEGKGTFDVVFECSGNAQALSAAYSVTRPKGLIVAIGLGSDASIPLSLAVTKEVRMQGTFRFDAEFGWAAELISSGAVDLSPLITSTISVERADEAFKMAGDRTQSMKVQLDFGAGVA
jgi:L-idonate 5-dehydrogenase